VYLKSNTTWGPYRTFTQTTWTKQSFNLRGIRFLYRSLIRRTPETIFGYRFEDFDVINYQAHPRIAAPVAV
jgi:thymidylate synthase